MSEMESDLSHTNCDNIYRFRLFSKVFLTKSFWNGQRPVRSLRLHDAGVRELTVGEKNKESIS